MFDIQVIVQAVVYFAIFICGFLIAIPVGLTASDFDGKCILYADITWKSGNRFHTDLSHSSTCQFPVGVAVFACIFVALGMCIYSLYVACRTKDPNVGFNMWVLPILLANAVVAVFVLVIACMISMGLKKVCDGLTTGYEGDYTVTCEHAQNHYTWDKYDGSHFYKYLTLAQAAAWIAFLLWGVEVSLYILRFVRLRRLRTTQSPSSSQPSKGLDNNIMSAANPSA